MQKFAYADKWLCIFPYIAPKFTLRCLPTAMNSYYFISGSRFSSLIQVMYL